MPPNRLLLSTLLFSLILFSCATGSDDAAISVPTESAESGQAPLFSEQNERGAVQPDTEEKESPEVSVEKEDLTVGEEEPEQPVEVAPFQKETRKGGKKDLPLSSTASDQEEFEKMQAVEELPPGTDLSLGEESSEEKPETPDSPAPAPVTENAVVDTTTHTETEKLISSESSVSPESSDTQMDPTPEDSLEMDYGVTIVNELPMGTAGRELPSERDQVDYNPLLPVVVDAPEPVRERSERSAAPETDATEPDRAVPDKAGFPESPGLTTNTTEAALPTDSEGETEEKEEALPLSDEDLEELYIDGTGKLIIELQGAGWIYISSLEDDTLSLKDKSYNPDSGTTRFVFTSSSGSAPGGKLVFLKQDLLKGESSSRSLDLENAFSAAPPHLSTPDPAESANPAEINSVNSAAESAETADAPPVQNHGETGQSPTETVTAEPQLDDETAVGGFPRNAADLLKQAEKYEAPGPDQSLEKALELYYRIKTEFPVTEERFIAETRIRYLNKHYFKVQ